MNHFKNKILNQLPIFLGSYSFTRSLFNLFVSRSFIHRIFPVCRTRRINKRKLIRLEIITETTWSKFCDFTAVYTMNKLAFVLKQTIRTVT